MPELENRDTTSVGLQVQFEAEFSCRIYSQQPRRPKMQVRKANTSLLVSFNSDIWSNPLNRSGLSSLSSNPGFSGQRAFCLQVSE